MDKFNIRKIEGYTIMSNHHLRDKNLSHSARGLLSFMLTLPDDWDYSFNGLVTISKEGKSAIRNMINELKAAKYIKITQYRNEKGFFQYNYDVYEIPYDMEPKNKDYPTPGYPMSGYPKSEKHPLINNNKQIDKIDKRELKIQEELNNLNQLTLNLIKEGYIDENDSSIFYYNDFLDDLLIKKSYKDLLTVENYVLKHVKEKNYEDEEGNQIINKFGYFKQSMISNLKKFEQDPNSIWDEEYDWLNDNLEL